jgi:dienelactone hydrolase
VALAAGASSAFGASRSRERTEVLLLRGRAQTLHLSGPPGGPPIVVASGDGGWMHLGPHVADWLAARGYFVVGFDTRQYLASFTSGAGTLGAGEVPGDLLAVIAFAARGGTGKPVVIGVSEGAGLAVLAGGAPAVQRAIGGIVTLGLPDVNELGWRWRDAVIYLTHGVPNEPVFRASAVIARVSPVPLAAIYSSRDEFVSADERHRLLAAARPPSRCWVIEAADHRFSDKLPDLDARLDEALAWLASAATR